MKIVLDCIIGSMIEGIGHAADMIWLALTPSDDMQWIRSPASIDFHFQSKTDLYLNDEHITGTKDLYPEESSYSQFEARIKALLGMGLIFQLESAFIDEKLNIILHFSNGLLLKSIEEGCVESDEERWRILIHNSNTHLPHFIAMGDHIEFY